jgi:hypothetical protein
MEILKRLKYNMEVLVYRKYKKPDYTVGRMSIDGTFICNTMEDVDRGLDDGMPDWMIRNKKIPNVTAIPTGRYEVEMNVVSPRFSKYPFYMEVCQGKLPRLKNVKGFEGVLLHCGSDHSNSSGCILLGLNKQKGKLTDSKETFKKVYSLMKEAHDRGETIYITIE